VSGYRDGVSGNGVVTQRVGCLLQVESTRALIDAALRHDFDTPRALKSLLDLVARGHLYINERQKHGSLEVVEAVSGVADLTRTILRVFGLVSVADNDGLRVRNKVGAPPCWEEEEVDWSGADV